MYTSSYNMRPTMTLVVHRKTARQQDRFQKIDRPVIMTGYSQQDFGFFKEEWERYTIASNVTEENLLRDMLLQCADLSLQKSLQHTIGSTALANMSVVGFMTEIEKEASGGVNSKLYEARGNVTTKKGHHILLWKDVWRG